MLVSIVIRTLNEEMYLDELLKAIANQVSDTFTIETIIVDSGSTDRTLEISQFHKAKITHIKKDEFSFGRSLNIGCEFAHGEILVFISGHCIPVDQNWLHNLCMPIAMKHADYTYGKQIGRDNTKFSERQVFEKYFPDNDMIPQEGFFCNNANSALRKTAWEKHRFDEELTGLEDMDLAKRMLLAWGKVGYTASACVYHIHNETYQKVKIRYEREAIALQKIMPEIHISLMDLLICITGSIWSDIKQSIKSKYGFSKIGEIIAFRICQFWGAYIGNHTHRKLSSASKRKYFYPNKKVTERKIVNEQKSNRANAHESSQLTSERQEL